MCGAMTVSDIMDSFGGLSAFADKIGVPTSTAFSWKAKNYIPEWRQREVLELALSSNTPLSTADFPQREERAA